MVMVGFVKPESLRKDESSQLTSDPGPWELSYVTLGILEKT